MSIKFLVYVLNICHHIIEEKIHHLLIKTVKIFCIYIKKLSYKITSISREEVL